MAFLTAALDELAEHNKHLHLAVHHHSPKRGHAVWDGAWKVRAYEYATYVVDG